MHFCFKFTYFCISVAVMFVIKVEQLKQSAQQLFQDALNRIPKGTSAEKMIPTAVSFINTMLFPDAQGGAVSLPPSRHPEPTTIINSPAADCVSAIIASRPATAAAVVVQTMRQPPQSMGPTTTTAAPPTTIQVATVSTQSSSLLSQHDRLTAQLRATQMRLAAALGRAEEEAGIVQQRDDSRAVRAASALVVHYSYAHIWVRLMLVNGTSVFVELNFASFNIPTLARFVAETHNRVRAWGLKVPDVIAHRQRWLRQFDTPIDARKVEVGDPKFPTLAKWLRNEKGVEPGCDFRVLTEAGTLDGLSVIEFDKLTWPTSDDDGLARAKRAKALTAKQKKASNARFMKVWFGGKVPLKNIRYILGCDDLESDQEEMLENQHGQDLGSGSDFELESEPDSEPASELESEPESEPASETDSYMDVEIVVSEYEDEEDDRDYED
jgi:hypothetical protein